MNKKFLQSLAAGILGLTLAASCSMLKKEGTKAAEKNSCSAKKGEAHKCSADKAESKKVSEKVKKAKHKKSEIK
jgi:hypothetical protein